MRNELTVAAGLCALAINSVAHAQAPAPIQVPQQLDISRQRVPVAPLSQEAPLDLKLQSTEASPIAKSVDEIRFEIRDFDIQGATVFTPEELKKRFAALSQGTTSLGEVRQVTQQLESDYKQLGYFLVRVFIPPQSISEGQLRIQVVEGYVGELQIEGAKPEWESLIRARFEQTLQEKPVRLVTLEEALLNLNDIPGMNGQGVLKQGKLLGSSVLTVTISEPAPAQSLSLNNNGSTLTGPWNVGYSGSWSNPLGNGLIGQPHTLAVGLNGSGGLLKEVRSVNALLTLPLGTTHWVGSFGALAAEARPGGAVQDLDLLSTSSSMSLRLRYPLLRTRANSVFFDTGLSVNRSETNLSGLAISADQTSVGEAGLSWNFTTGLGSTQVSLSRIQGLGILGAMDKSAPSPSVPGFEPDFSKEVLNLQQSIIFSKQWSAQLSLQAQETSDKLLTGEQIAFGGSSSARAYDPSTLTGDKGVGATLEVRFDLPQFHEQISNPQLYAFTDAARANSLPTAGTRAGEASLASVGVGMRFVLSGSVLMDAFYAQGQRDKNLQVPVEEDRFVISSVYRF